jgi:hypothetical protein
MEYKESYPHPMPPESASRKLDFTVRQSEMPYGYETSPPPADTGDYNMERLQDKKRYRNREM